MPEQNPWWSDDKYTLRGVTDENDGDTYRLYDIPAIIAEAERRTKEKIRKDVELLAREDEIQEHGVATGNSSIRDVLNLDNLK